MKTTPFNIQDHIYRNEQFEELVKDSVRFFNGTPVNPLPPPEKFTGTGVYALYYTGDFDLYEPYKEINRLAYNKPIYVGKAVPAGWRQSRTSDKPEKQSSELFRRLNEHARSIATVENLDISDFSCRFVIFESASSDMIGTVEAALIKLNTPLWNSKLDGFGNHDPGSGRYQQAKSDWDVVHKGRFWADRLTGKSNAESTIIENVKHHLKYLKNESN